MHTYSFYSSDVSLGSEQTDPVVVPMFEVGQPPPHLLTLTLNCIMYIRLLVQTGGAVRLHRCTVVVGMSLMAVASCKLVLSRW